MFADSLCKLIESLFLQWIANLVGAPHLLFFFFSIPISLKLIVACRLCVIYVREDTDSNVEAVITQLIWILWTSLSAIHRKAGKFNHSFIHSFTDGTKPLPEPMLTDYQLIQWHSY